MRCHVEHGLPAGSRHGHPAILLWSVRTELLLLGMVFDLRGWDAEVGNRILKRFDQNIASAIWTVFRCYFPLMCKLFQQVDPESKLCRSIVSTVHHVFFSLFFLSLPASEEVPQWSWVVLSHLS